MENKTDNALDNISLDDLYGHLKNIDLSILKRLGNPAVTDLDYLFCGVLSDLVSNAQSLLINKISANIDSLGVDNNCKKIIESICVLNMISKGKVSHGKAKIYRYLYPFSNEENIRKLLTSEDSSNKVYENLISSRNKDLKNIEEAFKWDDAEALKKVGETNHYFGYLKDKVSDNINMETLLKEYPVYDEEKNQTYKFFSSSIHPHFEIDDNLKLKYDQLRKKNIDIVIDYVMKFISENNLINHNKQVVSFSKDFINNPFFKNHIENASWINGAFEYIKDSFATVKGKKDSYLYEYFTKLNSLCIDMFVCLSLGLCEQVLNKFTSFAELAFTNYFIISSDDVNKERIKKALCVSSRINLESYLNEIKEENSFNYSKDLEEIFNSFYKDKYSISIEDFKSNLLKNPFYYLDKKNNDALSLTQNMLSKVYSNIKKVNNFELLYQITKDLSHSSRYNFASGQIIVDILSQKTLQAVYEYLIEILNYLEKDYSNKGIKVKSESAADIFKDFVQNEESIIKEDIKYIADNFKN